MGIPGIGDSGAVEKVGKLAAVLVRYMAVY
jgi:hypothetical protein